MIRIIAGTMIFLASLVGLVCSIGDIIRYEGDLYALEVRGMAYARDNTLTDIVFLSITFGIATVLILSGNKAIKNIKRRENVLNIALRTYREEGIIGKKELLIIKKLQLRLVWENIKQESISYLLIRKMSSLKLYLKMLDNLKYGILFFGRIK